MYAKFFKRIFDFSAALLGIIALLPIYVVLAILIRIYLGSPIIFRQARPGLDERIFNLVKFRSMNCKTDANGELLPDKDRITKLGSFLRKTSLDELPELFNVLKGDMSFVGPRPLLPRYLPYYTQTERKRHSVRPGITGLAQVSGRNKISWNEKLACDAEYVDNLSFSLDIKILFSTFAKVLKCSDIQVVSDEGAFDEVRAAENASKEEKRG